MLRFFHVNGFEHPVALELSNPGKPMYELLPDKTLRQVSQMAVVQSVAAAQGQLQRADIFVINVSNTTFAVYGSTLPDATVHALEADEKWPACDVGGAPDDTWNWRRIGAKAALIAWLAAQRRKDEGAAAIVPMN